MTRRPNTEIAYQLLNHDRRSRRFSAVELVTAGNSYAPSLQKLAGVDEPRIQRRLPQNLKRGGLSIPAAVFK